MTHVFKRIKYFDAIKFFAIMGIIFLHSFNFCNPVMIKGFNLYDLHQIGRFGVPIFLCVSGALLLGRKDYDFPSFLKKRLIRICYPLIFFIILSYVLNIYDNPLTAFWYCWMILGVYLSIPFINKIVLNSEIREIEYFLLICISSSIFYQIMMEFGYWFSLDLNFFITPITYLILGYYLSVKEFNFKPNKILLCCIAMFIVSTVLKMNFGNTFDIYPKISIMYSSLDFSVFQMMQACSVFLFCRFIYDDVSGIFLSLKTLFEGKIMGSFIESVSRSSYGMYLVHMLFLIEWIRPFPKNVILTNKETAFFCCASFIFLFVISWIIVLILSRMPYINKISGYA